VLGGSEQVVLDAGNAQVALTKAEGPTGPDPVPRGREFKPLQADTRQNWQANPALLANNSGHTEHASKRADKMAPSKAKATGKSTQTTKSADCPDSSETLNHAPEPFKKKKKKPRTLASPESRSQMPGG